MNGVPLRVDVYFMQTHLKAAVTMTIYISRPEQLVCFCVFYAKTPLANARACEALSSSNFSFFHDVFGLKCDLYSFWVAMWSELWSSLVIKALRWSRSRGGNVSSSSDMYVNISGRQWTRLCPQRIQTLDTIFSMWVIFFSVECYFFWIFFPDRAFFLCDDHMWGRRTSQSPETS